MEVVVSERVRAYVTGEPPDRVWRNADGEVIAHEPDPLPDQDVETVRRALRLLTVTPGRDGEAAIGRIEQRLRESGRVRVGSEREGWRARLANVERLLAESLLPELPGQSDRFPTSVVHRGRFDDALAEIQSMIDGDEVPS